MEQSKKQTWPHKVTMRNAGVNLEGFGEGWGREGFVPVHSTMFFKMLEMPSMGDVYHTLNHKRKCSRQYFT